MPCFYFFVSFARDLRQKTPALGFPLKIFIGRKNLRKTELNEIYLNFAHKSTK
jgi:hypothetical protein